MKERSLPPQQSKLLDAAAAIRLDPEKIETAFMARQLVQATLPHKNPGNVPAWSRTNGNLTLGIQPGYNFQVGKSYGYPYGTIPRLLLFWITTEAVKTGQRRLELGKSLAAFMRQLGLNPATGRGKRGDAKRLQAQMQRLFQARISFHKPAEEPGRTGQSWLHMEVAPEGLLWWDEKEPEQGAFWESWIKLGEEFFKALVAAPVPVDMRALRALKRSPLALDLYAWASHTAFRTQQSGQARFVAWKWLHEQMGAEYRDLREFARKARLALRKVQAVYPAFGMEYVKGGINVLPCHPHVTVKVKRYNAVDEESYAG